jgi:signal recognition particle subunit SRP54
MTYEERRNPAILNGSRRRRIAQGSGTTVTDVNRLIKQFLEMKKMMQRMNKGGMRGLFNRMSIPFN